jgi:flavin-dependent dehydrogenase
MSTRLETLIVGGGPAGAAAAIHLGRNGRLVTLLEQSTAAHHKVCGDFLSREAIAYLDRLGLDLHRLGALPVYTVRLAAQKEIAACDLPFPALSLTRRSLDEALLNLASQSGAKIHRGCRLDSLSKASTGFNARVSNGVCLNSNTAFLATGKKDVAGHRRPAGSQNDLVAFKMYFRLSPAQQQKLSGSVELYLFPGGYAGLQPVEDHQANLCLLITRAALRHCDNQWPAVLSHLSNSSDLLAQRLDSAEQLLPKPLALSSIPYGMMRESTSPGLWPLGDQVAVIPSFSGDGISIALHSAQLAADFCIRGKSAMEFVHQLRKELRFSFALATMLSRLMIAAPALAHATRLWPALLGIIATRTRIPTRSWKGQPTLAKS